MIEAKDLRYEGVLGHDRIIHLLKNAITADRVAHAYLFCGPEGVGKRRCAHAFAAALLCSLGGDEACGSCPSCKKLCRGNHPDFHEIVPTGKGRVLTRDSINELIRQTRFAPFESRWKVFLLLEAERMRDAGANALLKTLEEPTRRTVIVLMSAMPQGLWPTILSRCQNVVFGPLRREVLAPLIAEMRGMDEADAGFLARLSEGSVGRALAMDLKIALEDRLRMGRAFYKLRYGQDAALMEMVQELMSWPEGLEEAFEIVKTLIADALRLSAGGDKESLIHEVLAGEAEAFALAYSTGVLAAKVRSVTCAQRLLARNANKRLTAEALLLDLMTPRVTGFAKRIPR